MTAPNSGRPGSQHESKIRIKRGKTSLIGICILAGGLSTRMGRDKATLKLGGSTLLTIVRRTARELGRLNRSNVRTIRRDRVPRCGPMGGIYTALMSSLAHAELFLACDMPFLEIDLLQRLIVRHLKTGRATFARSKAGAGFPFLLPSHMAAKVKAQIDRKEFSIQRLAKVLDASFVNIGPRDAQQLMNVNTPAEWEEARRRWERK